MLSSPGRYVFKFKYNLCSPVSAPKTKQIAKGCPALAAKMSSFLTRSTWLRLFAIIHVLSGAGVRSFGPNPRCVGTRTQQQQQQQSIGRGLWAPTRAAARLPRDISCSCRRRRPRERRTGLNMAPLYKDSAEADFYAKQLQDLITAYALKTANHYWMELRGNMYAEWLTRYIAECGGIESIGWHAFLSGMLRAPPEDIIVKKLIKSPRGGSGNNPFLKDRKPVEYTETIEPTTIARRLMEIRGQMAEQLSADLQQMAAENAKLQRDYADESELGPDRAQALRMSVLEPMVDVDPSSGMANPPQRRAAYQTAVELATAASMRRVKSELRIRGDRRTLDWLDRFSDRELGQRGNALIQSLIAGPLVFINDPSRARPKVIEPLKVAQDIMQERELLAEEFIEVLEKVPQDHVRMTVSLLNEKWESPGDIGGEKPDARES